MPTADWLMELKGGTSSHAAILIITIFRVYFPTVDLAPEDMTASTVRCRISGNVCCKYLLFIYAAD